MLFVLFFGWNPKLNPHAKFQNPGTTTSGIKVTIGEERKKERTISAHADGGPCSPGSAHVRPSDWPPIDRVCILHVPYKSLTCH